MNNQANHTPGPWKATPPDDAETACYWTITAGSEGHNSEKEICVLHCGPATTEGNAKLIAAAPGFLRVLEEIEQKHIMMNARINRPESDSRTLKLVRSVLEPYRNS